MGVFVPWFDIEIKGGRGGRFATWVKGLGHLVVAQITLGRFGPKKFFYIFRWGF